MKNPDEDQGFEMKGDGLGCLLSAIALSIIIFTIAFISKGGVEAIIKNL